MWLYEGNEFIDIPEKVVGFVYRITNTTTGRQYIGKKLFTKAGYKQVLGKRKKIRKESDWATYYGSNEELICDVRELGPEVFMREILYLGTAKGWCSYWEAKLQFQYGVLEHPELFYNAFIGCKIHRKHLKQ